MTKFLSRNYDITDEVTSGNIEKVAKLIEGMDNSIRNAYIPSAVEAASRKESDFGLILFDKRNGYRNKYAHYNKELTALNLKLLVQRSDDLPDEFIKTAATHLKPAAIHWKIDFPEKLEQYVDDTITSNFIDVNSIDKKAYYMKLESNKTPVENEEFALKSEKKYPIHSEVLVKQAFDYFNNYARELEVPDRIEYAKNIFPKLAEYKIKPTALIDKLAHIDTHVFNEDFPHHIRSRKTMTHDETTQSAYSSLLEKVGEWTPTEVAIALDKIDKNAGLHYHYDRKIEEPVSATLGMKKIATYEIDDRVLSQDEYDSMVSGDLSAWVDVDTASALKGEDGVDVFRSLPSPIREGIMSEVL